MMEKRRTERSDPKSAFADGASSVTYGRAEGVGSFISPDFGAFAPRPDAAEPPAPRRRSNAAGMALAAGGVFGVGLCLFLAFALSGGTSKHPASPDLSLSAESARGRIKETVEMVAEPGPAVLRLGKRAAAPEEPEDAPALFATREAARSDYYHSPARERQTPPVGFYHDPFAPAPVRTRPTPDSAKDKAPAKPDAKPYQPTDEAVRRRELLKRMAGAEAEDLKQDGAQEAEHVTPQEKTVFKTDQDDALAAKLRRAAKASAAAAAAKAEAAKREAAKTEAATSEDLDADTLAGPRAASSADFGAVEALVRSGAAPGEPDNEGTAIRRADADAESDPFAEAPKPSPAVGKVKVRQADAPAMRSNTMRSNVEPAAPAAKSAGALPPGCAGRAFSSGGVDYFLDPESRRFYVVHQGPADVSKYSYAEYRQKSRTLMLVTTPGVKFDVGKPVSEFTGELGRMREVGVVPAGGKFSDAKIFPLAVDADR